MFSNELESIPSENLEELATYLNRSREEGQRYVRHDIAAREASVPEQHALTVFSVLCDEGALQAKLKVRCPECASSHGRVFTRQSAVPNEIQRCMCGEEFDMGDQANWEVVYEITEDDHDFFLDLDDSLKTFSDEAFNVSQSYVEDKYERLEAMENASYRGQLFDHFIAILFLQIEGVHAIPRYPNAKRGEIDVLINLTAAPDYLVRSLGHATLVENKWQSERADISDYDAFESKVREINRRHEVKIAFFVSMAGYKSSFDEVLNQDESPRTVGLGREHVEQMVDAGTAEPVIQEKCFP
jgi:hypothetical protein